MEKAVHVIIQDIIKAELELPDDYGTDENDNIIPVIISRDQNIILGNTEKLQITVGVIDVPRTISSVNKTQDVEGVLTEIQQLLQLENVQIDLQSKNNDARDRKHEIKMALRSIYAKQMMDKYKFKIFRDHISFVNSGAAEGASQLNRFSIVVPCHVWYNKTKEVTQYYDNFPARVDNEDTIGGDEGIIEFDAEDNPDA